MTQYIITYSTTFIDKLRLADNTLEDNVHTVLDECSVKSLDACYSVLADMLDVSIADVKHESFVNSFKGLDISDNSIADLEKYYLRRKNIYTTIVNAISKWHTSNEMTFMIDLPENINSLQSSQDESPKQLKSFIKILKTSDAIEDDK